MSTPKEWADNLAKDLESKQRTSDTRDRHAELQREIIAEQWPLLWEEVVREFQAHCDAFNERLKPERRLALHRDAHGFIIRPDALPEIVSVRHDPQAKRIEVKTPKRNLSLGPAVERAESRKLFLVDNYRKYYSPAHLAQKSLQEGVS